MSASLTGLTIKAAARGLDVQACLTAWLGRRCFGDGLHQMVYGLVRWLSLQLLRD